MTDRVVSMTRRAAMRGAAGTLALSAAAKAAFPAGAFAQGAGPETKGAKLGYIALTDAAPLIVPKERASSSSTASPRSRRHEAPQLAA